MHHQVAMRIGDGVADAEKDLQSSRDAEAVLIAVCVELDSVDILHHQVWLARLA